MGPPSFRLQRRMMKALYSHSSDFDAFPYILAEHLHMTVGEVMDMAHDEYMGWAAYLTAKNAKLTERA